MTTSWALLLDGRFLDAARTNLGGVILCLTAICVAPVSAWIAWRGKAANEWFTYASVIAVITALVIAVVEWLVRLLL